MELSGASVSVLDSMCPHVKEEPASKYQAIFGKTPLKDPPYGHLERSPLRAL